MSMQTPRRQMTAAETALLDAFHHHMGDLPGNSDVIAIRDAVFDDLKQNGLPTRREEAWHYTDLKSLLKTIPAGFQNFDLTDRQAVVADSFVLTLSQIENNRFPSIEGVLITSYADLLSEGKVSQSLSALDAQDAIGKINASFVRDGFVIDVADNFDIEKPLEIQFSHHGGQLHTRCPVRFGTGSKATVIERHQSVSDDPAFVTSVSEVSLGAGAAVTWIILQQQGVSDTHLGQIRVELGENARLRLFVLNAGGQLVRQELHLNVAGEGADITLRGINLLGGESHTDVTMVLGHNVPHTTSTEIIRSVVFDRAKGVFQGMIRVAPDAQKTDAKMACNTLLMSDDAEFSIKPELEIFADDVQCGHGATVSDIDQNHLYYLMARGIPEKKARAMLVNAFVAEIVEELDNEALVEALENIISSWLEKHA